jgi:hypothetical protein
VAQLKRKHRDNLLYLYHHHHHHSSFSFYLPLPYPKNLKIKIYKNRILHVVYMGVELGLSPYGRT